jgi:hypothetical protein
MLSLRLQRPSNEHDLTDSNRKYEDAQTPPISDLRIPLLNAFAVLVAGVHSTSPHSKVRVIPMESALREELGVILQNKGSVTVSRSRDLSGSAHQVSQALVELRRRRDEA